MLTLAGLGWEGSALAVQLPRPPKRSSGAAWSSLMSSTPLLPEGSSSRADHLRPLGGAARGQPDGAPAVAWWRRSHTAFRVACPTPRLSRRRAARAEGTAPTTATTRWGRSRADHCALRQGHTHHQYRAPGLGSGSCRN
jgi:hypothetical protein